MVKVYLAGAMDYYRKNDPKLASKWRTLLKNYLVSMNDNYNTNFNVFDPTLNERRNHDVVSQNLHYLKECDVLVLNLDHLEHSLGSIAEFSYFGFNGKPIITIGNHIWQQHPYMKKFVSYSAKNEREVAEFLRDLYGQ